MHSLLLSMFLQNSAFAEDSTVILDREYLMQTNVRVRKLFLPDSILDTWFYNADTEGAQPRPKIEASVVGLEYAFINDRTHWTIWGEYMGSKMQAGYWDDVEKGETVDHDDGDWVRPDNFSGWWGGFQYAYAIPISPREKGILVDWEIGGGLGAGYITGDLTYWRPGSAVATGNANDCEPVSPAYVRQKICDPDGVKEFPRFLPMLDITTSININFSDRAHVRFDTGLHDMLYYGMALGGTF